MTAVNQRLLIWVVSLLGVAAVAWLGWPLLFLGPNNPRTTMYVQIPSSDEGPVFHQKLARILAEKVFRLHLGRSHEEPSKATYVLDARGLLTSVWSQNALIDPEEALRCGYAVSADHPITNDQRQYSVVVRAVPFASSRAGVIFSELREQLLQHGYGVSDYQQPCKRLS